MRRGPGGHQDRDRLTASRAAGGNPIKSPPEEGPELMADLKWPQRRPTGGIFLSDAFHPMKESEKTRLKQCRDVESGESPRAEEPERG